MKRTPSIFTLFEGRGAGGPTVTVDLPQKLAEDLLRVLHEALEASGGLPSDGDEDEELDDEEAAEDDLEDDFDDGEPGADDLFGMGDEGGDEDRPAGDEIEFDDEDGEPKEVDIEDAYEPGAQASDIGDHDLDEKHLGFKKLASMIGHKGGVRDPNAVAASIGMKKYHTHDLRGVPKSRKH